MADVRLVLGDCCKILPTLEAESIDAVITDPPYGIDYQSAWRTDREQWKPKIANDKQPFVWWLRDAFRLLKDSGCLLCFCRWDVQEAFRLAITWAGFDIKSQVIWDREAHGMGDLTGAFAPQHDTIWFAVKDEFAFPGRRPKSVIRSKRLGGAQLEHPNEKPVELMQQLVCSVTEPWQTVLDPFAGSGSTLLACERTDRNAVGVELNPEYVALAEGRLQASRQSTPLFAAASQ